MSTLNFSIRTALRSLLWGGLTSALLLGCNAPGSDSDSDGGGTGGGGTIEGCEADQTCQASAEQVRSTCEDSRSGPRLLRRLTRSETDASLRDIFPELNTAGWAGVKLSVDSGSKLGFSNDANLLVVGGSTAREWQKTAEEVADVMTEASVLGTFLPCASAADAACATEFVNKVGRRLFRRPLSADETKRYADFHASVAGRSDFTKGLKWTLSSMIQSPNAIYRREIGSDKDGKFELDQFELASEIAYMYSGSTPDEELLQAAESGALDGKEALRAQAERLLNNHPRRLVNLENFFVEWLNYRKVMGQSRVEDPDFAMVTSNALMDETRIFTDTIVFGDNGSIRSLLTADYTSINGVLSKHYGFGELAEGAEFTRVQRPAGQGVGLLAQGSLLASTSHQSETSPTLRGLLFYTRFLCNSRPKVPDVVPPISETAGDVTGKTTRQKFEEHHSSQGACAACHKPFEPFGYTLEQFDELGRYRADEDGLPLDTVAMVTLPSEEEVEVTSQESLAQLIDKTDDIENCISGLLTTYMFSGAGGQVCLAEPERKALAEETKGLRDFLLDLTQTPHFSSRF